MSSDEKKPLVQSPTKSSMEILSELFSSFDAEPPLIIKKEKEEHKKHKKSKKKHKHKEKKHKKKDKKRKRHDSSSSSGTFELDLSNVLVKKEAIKQEEDIKAEHVVNSADTLKISGLDNCENLPELLQAEAKSTETSEESTKKNQSDGKIVIKDLKFSSIFKATVQEIKQKHDQEKSDGEISNTEDCQEKKDKHKKRHHRHSTSEERTKRHKSYHHTYEKVRSRSGSRKRDKEDSPQGHKYKHKDDYKSRDIDRSKEKNWSHKHREREDVRDARDFDQDDYRYRDRERNKRYKDNSFYKGYDGENLRESDDRWLNRSRYVFYNNSN